MRRWGWILAARVAQLLLGSLLAGMSLYLLSLIRSPEIKRAEAAAEAVLGLKIASGLIAPLAWLVLAGARGLSQDKLWGWWFAVLTDFGLVGVFAYGLIDDGWNSIDWGMVTSARIPLVAMVLLLCPPFENSIGEVGFNQSPQAAVGWPPA
jgi:hypothetical protein